MSAPFYVSPLIRDRARAKQLPTLELFGGTVVGTDLDGLFDFGDWLVAFIETKYGPALGKDGQRLAFVRLMYRMALPTLWVNARHDVHDANSDVPIAPLAVMSFRYSPGAQLCCGTCHHTPARCPRCGRAQPSTPPSATLYVPREPITVEALVGTFVLRHLPQWRVQWGPRPKPVAHIVQQMGWDM